MPEIRPHLPQFPALLYIWPGRHHPCMAKLILAVRRKIIQLTELGYQPTLGCYSKRRGNEHFCAQCPNTADIILLPKCNKI
ncbi:hypothetical protein NSND_50686 [Nitrospira sp. ND1]|nr:hypothetical protein NSND_50686 [Nitrospira sp. ND1]